MSPASAGGSAADGGEPALIGVTGSARADLDAVREIAGAGSVVDLDEAEGAPDITALVGASPEDDLRRFPSLRWVHSTAAGVDVWLTSSMLPDHVTLTSAAGNGAIPLAEHALMLMLMLSRDAPRWARAQQRHDWERRTHGELAGAQLGIIGYGNSGKDLARKALACHMDVQALRRQGSGKRDGAVQMLYGDEGLRDLLRSSDMIVVTSPLTVQTAGMIGSDEIALMRPGSALIVVSRGGIVDEAALVAALHSGHLGGAGIDAHATEPLPASSPLWDAPGAIVTPHNAATTPGTVQRGRAIMLDNVSRWVRGNGLRNVVDRAAGY
ncbi:D-2-hydroxyacid dehydrogenase [Brachybacterium sp. FME24]|uniref:D-2-hydroxyacid dehydrogenase n=1 Tax=Brachybacterium sp. FME24 TaxID=2742605 RepID=UPI0027155F40|nr:D-2-hydroxyacid dehydrogenase [Brachybacterium sp. FME24]